MNNKHIPADRRQWTNAPNNFTDLLDWGKGKIGSASPLVWEGYKVDSFTLQVSTPKGWVLAPLNTWIVKIGDSFFIENNEQWIEDILCTTPLLFQHYVKALQQDNERLKNLVSKSREIVDDCNRCLGANLVNGEIEKFMKESEQ